jgi:hypothetical protein
MGQKLAQPTPQYQISLILAPKITYGVAAPAGCFPSPDERRLYPSSSERRLAILFGGTLSLWNRIVISQRWMQWVNRRIRDVWRLRVKSEILIHAALVLGFGCFWISGHDVTLP